MKYLSLVIAILLCSGFVWVNVQDFHDEPTTTIEISKVSSDALAGSTPLIELAIPFKEDVFCWRESYGRGVGTVPSACPSGMENQGGLCYKLCSPGYYGKGPVCWRSCPDGYRDDGAYCYKPSAYNRGAGYPWRAGDPVGSDVKMFQRCENDYGKGNCEKYGLIVYPKCKEGFYAAGCCVCSPKCPDGFTDIGVSCQKSSYGRGVGIVPNICSSGQEYDAGLCYQLCRTGFQGIGPVCWEVNCPTVNGQSWVNCGAGCAQTTNSCITAIIDMTTTPLVAVLSIAGMAVSGGASGAITATTSTGKILKYTSKAVKTASKITKAAIEQDLLGKAREKLNGQPMPAHQRKGIEEYAAMAYDATRTYNFDWRDFTSVDPTGLASVAAAYANPLCRDIASNSGVVKKVMFYQKNGVTLSDARNIAAQNGWQVATSHEILAAFQHHNLNVYAFGLMADGRFAVPVQQNHSNFSRGANIGAVGGNQGFFYTMR